MTNLLVSGANDEKRPFIEVGNGGTAACAPPVHPAPPVANTVRKFPNQLKHSVKGGKNFQTLSVSMDRLDLELNPPEDRYAIA